MTSDRICANCAFFVGPGPVGTCLAGREDGCSDTRETETCEKFTKDAL